MDKVINEEVLENISGGVTVNYDTGKYVYYTVVRGDCLSTIAARFNTNYQLVYAINKQVIGPNINLINPGMVLKIPVL